MVHFVLIYLVVLKIVSFFCRFIYSKCFSTSIDYSTLSEFDRKEKKIEKTVQNKRERERTRQWNHQICEKRIER